MLLKIRISILIYELFWYITEINFFDELLCFDGVNFMLFIVMT